MIAREIRAAAADVRVAWGGPIVIEQHGNRAAVWAYGQIALYSPISSWLGECWKRAFDQAEIAKDRISFVRIS